MQRQKHAETLPIRIKENKLIIEHIALESDDAVRYFEEVPLDARLERLEQAVSLGTMALRTIQTYGNLDLNDRKFKRIESSYQKDTLLSMPKLKKRSRPKVQLQRRKLKSRNKPKHTKHRTPSKRKTSTRAKRRPYKPKQTKLDGFIRAPRHKEARRAIALRNERLAVENVRSASLTQYGDLLRVVNEGNVKFDAHPDLKDEQRLLELRNMGLIEVGSLSNRVYLTAKGEALLGMAPRAKLRF